MGLLIFSVVTLMLGQAEAQTTHASGGAPEHLVVDNMGGKKVDGWRMRVRTALDQVVYDSEAILPADILWRLPSQDAYVLDSGLALKMAAEMRGGMGLYGESRNLKRLIVELWPLEHVQLRFGSEWRTLGAPLVFRGQAAKDLFERRDPCESWLTQALRFTGL